MGRVVRMKGRMQESELHSGLTAVRVLREGWSLAVLQRVTVLEEWKSHHFSMQDELAQICRLVPWEASGDSGVNFPAFCETEVPHHSWASSTHWIGVSQTRGKEWEQNRRLWSCHILDTGYCRVFRASFWIQACFYMQATGWQDCCKYSQ